MLRRGAPADQMGLMKDQDIFLERLKLLIIMTKAYLRGYPLGDRRKAAVIENARYIFYRVLQLPAAESGKNTVEHLFNQRAQLLAVMAQSFAEGNPVGGFRKKAIEENVAWICRHLAEALGVSKMEFLQVA